MALKGIRVVELAGLAPAPFCGMILSDFGANVIRVDKAKGSVDIDRLDRGKRSIALDLKHASGQAIVHKLCSKADVLIEPFRRGVMEKLSLGPQLLLKENPSLVYARLTGFGQNGPYADRAGHDINYIALAGILSTIGRKNDKPIAPINLLADFAGGGMLCALGICMALLERTRSGLGQVIDANMVEGSAYLGTWLWTSQDMYIWGKPRGENVLDTGSHCYDTYKTKDGKYVAVGALEPQFYAALLEGLNAGEIDQFDDSDAGKSKLSSVFATKTREEWMEIFEGKDACVMPVLDLKEAPLHRHNQERQSFLKLPNGHHVPRPAPLLTRSPACPNLTRPSIGQHTEEILKEVGYTQQEINCLEKENVVKINSMNSKL